MKALVFFFALIFSTVLLSQNDSPETTLKKGDKAPDFTLKDASAKEYTLSKYKGTPVVVYFYPKAGTSGCTKQACGIRDYQAKLNKSNVKVLGISTDSIDELKKFRDDYSLNFPLLSDAGKSVSKKYGVLSDNGLSKRYTFIIDKKGNIADIIEVKDIEHHAEQVYEEASKL